jgi:23S rRNA pseudouridine2604 synthase
MCEYLEYEVIKLKRVRIMNIHLDVPVGKWRYFTSEEIERINSLLSDSTKTFQPPTAHSISNSKDSSPSKPVKTTSFSRHGK